MYSSSESFPRSWTKAWKALTAGMLSSLSFNF